MAEPQSLGERVRAYLDDLTAGGVGVTAVERLAAIPVTRREAPPQRRRRVAIGAGLLLVAAAALAVAGVQRGGNTGIPAALGTGTPSPSTSPVATPAPAPTPTPRPTPAPGPSFAPLAISKEPPPVGASTWGLALTVEEVGLVPGIIVSWRVSGAFSGGYGCTDGSQPPVGEGNHSAVGSATLTLPADPAGEARGSLRMEPPEPQTACPSGQHNEYRNGRWTNVVVVDTGNGVTQLAPGATAAGT